MILKGILALQPGVLYTEVLYKDPDDKLIQVSVTQDYKDNPSFKICWIEKERYRIHIDLLYSVVAKDHGNNVYAIHRDTVTEANEVYCHGHRAISFTMWFGTAKLNRIQHEVCIYP